MIRPSSRRYLALAAASALVMPLAARAADTAPEIGLEHAQELRDSGELQVPQLSLDPRDLQTTSPDPQSAPSPSPDANASEVQSPSDHVLQLAGVGSRIHGFADFRINTQYITPRGLLAEKSSPQFQVVVGLVLDLYSGDGFINDVSVLGGAWGDFNTHPDKAVVTGADIWTEEDFFAGVDVKMAGKWDVAYTIQAWTFPDLTKGGVEIDPTTEYNMDLKVGFDDSEYLKAFALHPYVDVFWNFAGDSSPVVSQATAQGKNDHTFYVEIGIAPSYTWKVSDDYPITFTMPTYVSVGDSSFWGETAAGDRSNFGVFSTGLKISMPLKFIPQDFGNWSTYVGVTYYNTLNPALTSINRGSGADSNLVLGYAGVGFNF